MIWNGPLLDQMIVVKDAYRHNVSQALQHPATNLFISYWHRNIPTKIIIFGWLIWKGKALTWENLMKRGFMGPSICVLCRMELETSMHLFIQCPITVRLWRLFGDHYIDSAWRPSDFMIAVMEWDKIKCKYRALPFYLTWEIWLARNRIIFEDRPFHIQQTYTVIKEWMDECPISLPRLPDLSARIRPHQISLPALYFDGASVDGMAGCGAWIKLTESERYHMYGCGGPGSNNKAEVMALWGGLHIAQDLQVQGVSIYGDSLLVINWITNKYQMKSSHLQGWLERTQSLWQRLGCPPINHIYRESNTRADKLSKRGLRAEFGIMEVSHLKEGRLIEAISFPIP